MKVDNARVSNDDESLDLQLDALKKAGCKRVFTDKASAAKGERPGLTEAVSHLSSGDVLLIWKLDRLGRTAKGLVDFVADLQRKGRQFRSLTDGIDWTTPAGRFCLPCQGVAGTGGARGVGRTHEGSARRGVGAESAVSCDG